MTSSKTRKNIQMSVLNSMQVNPIKDYICAVDLKVTEGFSNELYMHTVIWFKLSQFNRFGFFV